MRTFQEFDFFYANVAHKSERLVLEPTLPRNRRTLARLEAGSDELATYPPTTKEGCIMKPLILSPVLSVSSYTHMESLLINTAIVKTESEFKFLEASCSKLYVDTCTLLGQLSVLEVMLQKEEISSFDDTLSAVTKEPEKKFVQEIRTSYKLLAVNRATSPVGERSWSSACFLM